jgi:hypothetical protein
MKAEIAAGADVFQVLDAQLTRMGVSTDVLANRTLGAAGATRTYAQAQEDLSLALGRLAEGPGVKVLGFLSQFTNTLTDIVSKGDAFASAGAGGQAIEAQLVAAATSFEDYKNRVTAAQEQINAAFAGDPIGAMVARNIAGLGELTPAQLQYAQSLIQTGTASTDAVAKAQHMSDVAQLLATQLNAVGGASSQTGQVLSSMGGQLLQLAASGQNGQEAVFALAGSFAAGEITAEQFRIVVEAQIGALDAQAQAAANAASLEAQRHGEQSTGAAVTDQATSAFQANTAALIDQAEKTLEATLQSQELAKFQEQLASLGGQVASGLISAGDAANIMAQQYGIASDRARELINLQAQLALAEQNRQALSDQRAGERDGGSARTFKEITFIADQERKAEASRIRRAEEARKGRKAAGAAKLSDQAKLNNQLLAADEKYQQQAEDAANEHARNVLEIERDFQEQMAQAREKFAQSQFDDRASFYDRLGSVEDAGLRQAMSAQYEAAAQEAAKIASEKGADAAEEFLAASRAAIEKQAELQQKINDARDKGDDGTAEYYEGVLALQKQADERRLNAIRENGSAIANAHQEALDAEGQRYQEQQDKIGAASDRATDRLVTNAQRAGKSISTDLIPPLQDAAALVERIGGPAAADTGGGGTTGAGGAPTTSNSPVAPTASAAPGALTDLAGIVEALHEITGAVQALEKTTRSGSRDIVSAVQASERAYK